jgi:hypothetical protein
MELCAICQVLYLSKGRQSVLKTACRPRLCSLYPLPAAFPALVLFGSESLDGSNCPDRFLADERVQTGQATPEQKAMFKQVKKILANGHGKITRAREKRAEPRPCGNGFAGMHHGWVSGWAPRPTPTTALASARLARASRFGSSQLMRNW